MIAGNRGRVPAFRAVWADGGVDGVDHVLRKEQLGGIRAASGRGIVG